MSKGFSLFSCNIKEKQICSFISTICLNTVICRPAPMLGWVIAARWQNRAAQTSFEKNRVTWTRTLMDPPPHCSVYTHIWTVSLHTLLGSWCCQLPRWLDEFIRVYLNCLVFVKFWLYILFLWNRLHSKPRWTRGYCIFECRLCDSLEISVRLVSQ